MANLRFDQVDVVLSDVFGATGSCRGPAMFERAVDIGGNALRAPYDAHWGAGDAAGSPADPALRTGSPAVADFA